MSEREAIYKILAAVASGKSYDSEYDGRMYTYCAHCDCDLESESCGSECLTVEAQHVIDRSFSDLRDRDESERILNAEKEAKRFVRVPPAELQCHACQLMVRAVDMAAHENSKRCIKAQARGQHG